MVASWRELIKEIDGRMKESNPRPTKMMAELKKILNLKRGWEVEKIQSRTNLNGGELERISRE